MLRTTETRVQVNPVYPGYFADPFVWKAGGLYYAIGTGAAEAEGRTAGQVFPLLRSEDFFNWNFAGKALTRPDPNLGNTFWAPEIAEEQGTFYLYYSAGFGDKNHQLRVATSRAPEGPYCDSGRALLDLASCPFAIDPHPFRDEDGKWYLFYARDFLDAAKSQRAGTALMVAPMRSMTELASEGIPVLRAHCDWQRFQQARQMYGRIWDWHTLEGPCVRKHDGRYYCFYSGGCWQNETYGVDYGTALNVLGPYSDSGNESGPRVLRSIPGRIIGPGHNSIVTGPDSGNEYLIYHAWDQLLTARRMFIEKLIWTPAGPKVQSQND